MKNDNLLIIVTPFKFNEHDFNSKQERDNFVLNAYKNKLLVNPTADKSIRIRPNLSFSDNELYELLNRINMMGI
jgi:acetylornithine/succinyldiaminopimelate/putrescine aminotransferase